MHSETKTNSSSLLHSHISLIKYYLHIMSLELDSFQIFNLYLWPQVSSYAIRDVEEYKNFCDRPRDQRPLPEEVIGVSLFTLFSFVHACMYTISLIFLLQFANSHSFLCA